MYRKLSIVLLVLSVMLLTAAFGTPFVGAQDANVDIYGRPLPEDAAPYDMQIWTELCNAARTEISLSSAVTVYQRICDLHMFDKFGDSLVVLDENLNLIPGAAETWLPSTRTPCRYGCPGPTCRCWERATRRCSGPTRSAGLPRSCSPPPSRTVPSTWC